jgi:uncharacterized protein YecE (DUF72 family)
MVDLNSIKVGCISWTYPDWQGSFYPEGAKSVDLLSLYSKVFDIVEIDSTFHRMPTPGIVKQWKEKTPANFLFTTKLSEKITHNSRLKDVSENLRRFETTIKGLGTKLACIIAQLPPNFKFEKNFDLLSKFLAEVDPNIRYAIELRDASWYRAETYNLMRQRKASLVWSVQERTMGLVKPEVTSDFLYLRFMGQFREFTKFDRVQKEKRDILEEWGLKLNEVPDSVRQVYVLASNHFEGFAPWTANSFRKVLGLQGIDWKEKLRLRQDSESL